MTKIFIKLRRMQDKLLLTFHTARKKKKGKRKKINCKPVLRITSCNTTKIASITLMYMCSPEDPNLTF